MFKRIIEALKGFCGVQYVGLNKRENVSFGVCTKEQLRPILLALEDSRPSELHVTLDPDIGERFEIIGDYTKISEALEKYLESEKMSIECKWVESRLFADKVELCYIEKFGDHFIHRSFDGLSVSINNMHDAIRFSETLFGVKRTDGDLHIEPSWDKEVPVRLRTGGSGKILGTVFKEYNCYAAVSSEGDKIGISENLIDSKKILERHLNCKYTYHR